MFHSVETTPGEPFNSRVIVGDKLRQPVHDALSPLSAFDLFGDEFAHIVIQSDQLLVHSGVRSDTCLLRTEINMKSTHGA